MDKKFMKVPKSNVDKVFMSLKIAESMGHKVTPAIAEEVFKRSKLEVTKEIKERLKNEFPEMEEK